jgi:hypothetical protein
MRHGRLGEETSITMMTSIWFAALSKLRQR